MLLHTYTDGDGRWHGTESGASFCGHNRASKIAARPYSLPHSIFLSISRERITVGCLPSIPVKFLPSLSSAIPYSVVSSLLQITVLIAYGLCVHVSRALCRFVSPLRVYRYGAFCSCNAAINSSSRRRAACSG